MTLLAVIGVVALGAALGRIAQRFDGFYSREDGRALLALSAWSWPIAGAVLAGTAGVAAAFLAGDTATVMAWGALVALLAALFVLDWRHGVLPDLFVVAVAILGAARAIGPNGPEPLEAVLGSAMAVTLFLGLRRLFGWLRGVEALGLGDVKLGGAAGLWCGWLGLPYVLIVACAVTLFAVFLARILGRVMAREVPFGPGLAVGLAVVAATPVATQA